jgi:outer membrane protein assembly factor BamA
VDAAFGVRPLSRLKLGASAGYVFNNVGKGTDSRYASTELVYSPAQAPGIDVQSDFLRVGGFAHYDWRDNPDGPRRGGNYFVQFSDYRDRSFDLSNFRRLDLEAQQFIPLLNDRRVFGVRARSTLTYREGGRPLPFYMQPSLGGSEDLRGYRPYRFRGDNLMVMNAEYRWEVFSGLDMAVFGDAGKVFMRKGDLALGDLETDIGVGLRFNSRNRTFLRLDVGFSHEGFQVWVRFTDVFKRAPVLSSSNLGGI